jgi:signal recognition particle subunit SRP68
MADVPETDEAEAVVDVSTLPKLSLCILEVVKTAQAQNGLRHNDHQRYRQYCTRRLRRVRKSVKFTYGKGRQFVHKEVTAEKIEGERHLYIPLMNAERSWAYAMHLKHEITESDNSRLKYTMMKKLIKAAAHSKQLSDLCTARGDNRTVLEAEAYAAAMAGYLLLEKEDWKEALENFLAASNIYEELGKLGSVEQQDLFEQQVTEIKPNIRYCKYNLDLQGDGATSADLVQMARGNTMLQSKLDSVMEASRKQQAEAMQTVDWRGEKLTVRDEEIRVLLLKAQEKTAELDQCDDGEKEGCYLEIFSAYDDVMRAVLSEQGKMEKMKSGQKVEAQKQELVQLEAYVTHHKTTQLVGRNMMMVADLTKKLEKQQAAGNAGNAATGRRPLRPDDLVHMYETLLNNLEELSELPGAEEDEAQMEKWELQKGVYRAMRVFYIAETYAGLSKWAEAMLLYDRAAELAEQDDDPALQELANKVTAGKNRVHGRGFLEQTAAPKAADAEKEEESTTSSPRKSKATKPLSKTLKERLSTYDAGDPGEQHKLVDFPPAFKPVPCKPLLFDSASNFLQFPNLSAKAGVKKKGEKDAAGGGIFGWLGGSK